MSYRNNVEAAASALSTGEDANWELARLTYENTRNLDGGRGEQPGKVTMEQWCADVCEASGRKFGTRTGDYYKRVWAKFGSNGRSDRPGWTDAMIEINPSKSMESRNERATDAHLREATPERKREIFQRLAEDEDVLEEKEQVLTTLLQDPLIQQKIKHNPESIPGIEDAVVDIASNSPRTAARVNVRYEEKHSEPERSQAPVNPLTPLGAFGAAASSVVRARSASEDVEKLLAWIDQGNLEPLDIEAVRSEIKYWLLAAQLCTGYANQMAIAIGDETQAIESPIERMSAGEIDQWIDGVLKGVS